MENDNLVKVEYVKKKKFNLLKLMKWPLGLYIIGGLSLILEFIVGSLRNVVFDFASQSEFLNVELSTISSLIRAPLIAILITTPFIIPTLVMFLLMKFVVDKFNIFSGLQRTLFLGFTIVLFSIVTIALYLQA